MAALRDTAKDKLNLTLEVPRRRDDAYHELRSLVAFTVLGDNLELEPGGTLALRIDGPFATDLSGDNLVIAAAEAARSNASAITLGRFRLVKNLPVAAGLGGGSADAASALRLLAGANRDTLDEENWREIAEGLGSDVPACRLSRPALMTGRGEVVTPVLLRLSRLLLCPLAVSVLFSWGGRRPAPPRAPFCGWRGPGGGAAGVPSPPPHGAGSCGGPRVSVWRW